MKFWYENFRYENVAHGYQVLLPYLWKSYQLCFDFISRGFANAKLNLIYEILVRKC